MSINFANKSLVSLISCTRVTADDYEVENLIETEDLKKRTNGFRVEYYIKPPVEVRIEFTDYVHIQSISFQSLSSNHIIDSMELLASSTPKMPSSFPIFEVISKVENNTSEEISFKNIFYPGGNRLKLSDNTFPIRKAMLRKTRILVIRIYRMKGSGVVGFKNLQVFGQPAEGCSEEDMDRIYGRIPSRPRKVSVVEEVIVKQSVDDAESSDNNQNQQIPEEFLDAITCEVMTIPYLLPSGHSVDSSTLERLVHLENCKGRPGCDPFTGVPFSRTSKPVPHTILKLRIDAFLVNGTGNAPRTLGMSQTNEVGQARRSKLVSDSNNSILAQLGPNSSNSNQKQTPVVDDDDVLIVEEATNKFKNEDKDCVILDDGSPDRSTLSRSAVLKNEVLELKRKFLQSFGPHGKKQRLPLNDKSVSETIQGNSVSIITLDEDSVEGRNDEDQSGSKGGFVQSKNTSLTKFDDKIGSSKFGKAGFGPSKHSNQLGTTTDKIKRSGKTTTSLNSRTLNSSRRGQTSNQTELNYEQSKLEQSLSSDHEENVSRSLEDSLQLAMQRIRGTSSVVKQTKNEPNDLCMKCDKSGPAMYSLPCGDLICRDCLVQVKADQQSECTKCSKQFNRREVVKCHPKQNLEFS